MPDTIIYRDEDADVEALRGKTVGIIGYGNQGGAQAQRSARQRPTGDHRRSEDATASRAAGRRLHGACRSPRRARRPTSSRC